MILNTTRNLMGTNGQNKISNFQPVGCRIALQEIPINSNRSSKTYTHKRNFYASANYQPQKQYTTRDRGCFSYVHVHGSNLTSDDQLQEQILSSSFPLRKRFKSNDEDFTLGLTNPPIHHIQQQRQQQLQQQHIQHLQQLQQQRELQQQLYQKNLELQLQYDVQLQLQRKVQQLQTQARYSYLMLKEQNNTINSFLNCIDLSHSIPNGSFPGPLLTFIKNCPQGQKSRNNNDLNKKKEGLVSFQCISPRHTFFNVIQFLQIVNASFDENISHYILRHALIYANNIVTKFINYGNQQIDSICPHCLLSTCLLLALKYIKDDGIDLNYWAKLCDMPVDYMVQMEKMLFKFLSYNLYISHQDFEAGRIDYDNDICVKLLKIKSDERGL